METNLAATQLMEPSWKGRTWTVIITKYTH